MWELKSLSKWYVDLYPNDMSMQKDIKGIDQVIYIENFIETFKSLDICKICQQLT